jgi:DNA-binding NarL/FixJ family response regulator
MQVVGAAADGAQAIILTAELHPGVVLMDLGRPQRPAGVGKTLRLDRPATGSDTRR